MIEDLSSLGVGAERIPLGADLMAGRRASHGARSPGKPLQLIHVASLNRVKDQPTLLRALAEMLAQATNSVSMWSATIRSPVKSRAAAYGLGWRNACAFRGFLRQTTLRSLMAKRTSA
jgi:hypothetical protein